MVDVNSCGELLGWNKVGERSSGFSSLPSVHALLPARMDDDALLILLDHRRGFLGWA